MLTGTIMSADDVTQTRLWNTKATRSAYNKPPSRAGYYRPSTKETGSNRGENRLQRRHLITQTHDISIGNSSRLNARDLTIA